MSCSLLTVFTQDCLCKITEQAFIGETVQPGTGTSAVTANTPPDSPPPLSGSPPTSFKCGCDFRSPDFSLASNEGLECDCGAAQCTCSRECTCSGAGTAGSVSVPRFREEFPAGVPTHDRADTDLTHAQTNSFGPPPTATPATSHPASKALQPQSPAGGDFLAKATQFVMDGVATFS